MYSGIPASVTACAAAADAFRIGERDGDAVGPLGDGRLDGLRLRLGVVVRSEELNLDAEVLAGLLGARLDHRPEHAAVAVGDHVEQQVLALHDVDGVAGCGGVGAAGGGRPGRAFRAAGGRGRLGRRRCVVTTCLLGSRGGVGVVVVARAGHKGQRQCSGRRRAHGGMWFSWMGPPLMLGG